MSYLLSFTTVYYLLLFITRVLFPLVDGVMDESLLGTVEMRTSVRSHQFISNSPKLNSPRLSYSPKLNSRETTHVNQINVADFANLREGSSRQQTDSSPANQNVPDYKYQMNKIRFKGASNSVPNYNDKQENIKKTVVAQNDALLSNLSSRNNKNKSRGGKPPIYVSKIEPKTAAAQKSNFLLPTTVPHRNKFMDLLLADTGRSDVSPSTARSSPDSLPRINFGSPTPLQKSSTADEDIPPGEITIIVPKLPQLSKTETQQSLTDKSDHRDRKSTRLNSSHQIISYAVFCLKKKTTT